MDGYRLGFLRRPLARPSGWPWGLWTTGDRGARGVRERGTEFPRAPELQGGRPTRAEPGVGRSGAVAVAPERGVRRGPERADSPCGRSSHWTGRGGAGDTRGLQLGSARASPGAPRRPRCGGRLLPLGFTERHCAAPSPALATRDGALLRLQPPVPTDATPRLRVLAPFTQQRGPLGLVARLTQCVGSGEGRGHSSPPKLR